jgi:thioredoxin 1
MHPRIVIALCAEWCGVCREFRAGFDAAARALSGLAFAWIDIESRPETEGVDLETLPTLLVVEGDGRVRFYGPVPPRASAIEQLVRGLDPRGPAIDLPATDRRWIDALVAAVRGADPAAACHAHTGPA